MNARDDLPHPPAPGTAMIMRAALLLLMALANTAAPAAAQQRANPRFDATVADPAFPAGEGPRVLFDDAHHNFHTSDGRYAPFVQLMRADGFRVASNRDVFTAGTLRGHDILVISSARGAPLGQPGQAQPAFTETEADAVAAWVHAGGGLLLITDHPPAATPPRRMAERFGITLIDAAPRDTLHFLDGPNTLVFSRPHGTLADHSITRGRHGEERIRRVVTFSGNSIVPPSGADVLLRLPQTALEGYARPPVGDTIVNVFVPAVGTAQGIALVHGRGRVVILGEAAAWTSQIFGEGPVVTGMDEPGFDNRQFILNVMRWLGGLLPATVASGPLPDTAFDPAIDRPVHDGDGPRVAIDSRHHNLFTRDGRLTAFSTLLAADGYRTASIAGRFTPASLEEADLLVIAGPRGEAVECAGVAHWLGSTDCAAAGAALDDGEIEALTAWVRDGGALLLALEPFPSDEAARNLARAFGIDVTGGFAFDWLHAENGRPDRIRFEADSGSIAEHEITRDVDRIVLFGATALSLSESAEATPLPLLRYAEPAIAQLPIRTRRDTLEMRSIPIDDHAAAFALRWGRGRVVVIADADLLTSQRFEEDERPVGLGGPGGHANRRFVRNLLRWLTAGR